jgi:protein TonB
LAEGDVLPIVRIEPQYPRDALIEGIEGYVVVGATIATDGSVKDVWVIQAEPKRVFDRNVIRAVLKWKFKPRIINGVPVERRTRHTVTFTLDEFN